MRINLLKEVQSVLSVIVKDSSKDELSKDMAIWSVHERQITALKDYINNSYVGETAIQLINFYQDLTSGDEIANEYSKLYEEVESDIKMAKAMGDCSG